MKIDSITISGLLPRVFAQEEIPESRIWRAETTFRRGQRYLIEAASGGGKSSLAAFLMGSRDDYEGMIRFNDRDARTIGVDEWQEIRRSNLAYLPQELSLFGELSALDNILLKAGLTEGRIFNENALPPSEASQCRPEGRIFNENASSKEGRIFNENACRQRIEDWMKRLGVWFRKDYPAGRLSIGQQQRVALIRSLCQPFDFILLDEPVSHLDDANNRIAAEMVMEEADRQGAGIITFSVGNALLIDNPIKLNL